VTAAMRFRTTDGRVDASPGALAAGVVGLTLAIYLLSQLTKHNLSPLGGLALLVACVPFVMPESTARRALFALTPMLLMYAFADAWWHPGANIVLNGVITGLLTSLLAVGIVIVYRANRIVNFAQAEMGAVPANLTLLLVSAVGWNYWLATAIGFFGSILLGVLVEFLFLRRFFKAPRLIATVATIGVSQILLGLSLLMPMWLGDADEIKLPDKVPWTFQVNSTTFTGNEILVLLTVPIVLALLALFFRYSMIGTALRATAESADRASMLGIPVRRLQSVLWGMVGLLAFITIFLRIGVVGASITSAMDSTVLLSALGAAFIGRMERLPTTVCAAVGIGIVSQAVFFAWDNAAARPVVITAIIAIALLTQRGGHINRLRNSAISTWQASREIRPIPAELRREKPIIAAQVFLGILVALVLLYVPLFLNENRLSQITTIGIYAIVGIALVILTGWAGQVSLGQMAFVGVSGAFAGWFVVNFNNPVIGGMLPAMLVGGLVGAVVTIIIGVPTLRARGLTFAVMSLAFALITSEYLLNSGHSIIKQWLPTADRWYQNGETLSRPPLLSFGKYNFVDLKSQTSLYVLVIVTVALVMFAARGLRKTRSGRVLIGVRENERAAEAYSVNSTRTLVLAFGVSGFITGLAGALLQMQQQSVAPELFGVGASLQLFAMVVVGGLGSIGGAILGAIYVFGAQYWLPGGGWSLLATGAGVLIVLLVIPGGIGAALGDARNEGLRWYARRKGIRVPSLVADTRVVDAEVAPEAKEAFIEALERPELEELAELHE
jgi:branched-chain amino acid transport system permease protein